MDEYPRGTIHIVQYIKDFYPQYWNKFETHPAEQCACVGKTKDEWGILSNFSKTPLIVNGVEFCCAEQLFQMMQFQNKKILKELHILTNQKLRMRAKRYMKEGFQRKDWGSFFIDAMKYSLMVKYQQSEEFRSELNRSKGLFIVDDQSIYHCKEANAWGTKLVDGNYTGSNLFGQLLTELRDNGKLEYNLPDDALNFIEHLKE